MAHRIVIYGNAGSGKTTMARATAAGLAIPRLDLDAITWDEPLVRKDLAASTALLEEFIAKNREWVIEGCYGDVIPAALPHCTELCFLNPGIDVCVEHCRSRPWEPTKFATREEQDKMLDGLISWVRQYETRDDEYGLARHRALFESFRGAKRELR
jgi:adenylate kinase family enzyme